jgi:outer membrane protein OmpA-like peptidoglycan-associated protein
MIGLVVIKRGGKDEAEKPFWISFADLMSALMVLFLLVMSVALLAVTKTVSDAERKKAEREHEIEELLTRLEKATARFPGVSVDRRRNVVDFGDRARFDTASHQLREEQARLLRAFVPGVLAIAKDEVGVKWLKRVVVEGFADQRGTYLFNLNLSLQRSQRVLCVLLANALPGEEPLAEEQKESIRELFLVGGYSFNSQKASLDESRRIEFRLEFYGVDEGRATAAEIPRGNFGVCSI